MLLFQNQQPIDNQMSITFNNNFPITQKYGSTYDLPDFDLIDTNRRNKSLSQFAAKERIYGTETPFHGDPNFLEPFLPGAYRGSYIQYDVEENGIYQVSGQFFTKEKSDNSDSFGYWAEDEYHELLNSGDTFEIPGFGGFYNGSFEIPSYDGKINLMIWDTDNNRRTSSFKIDSIELIETFEEPELEPELEPEPRPIPFVQDAIGNHFWNGEVDIIDTDNAAQTQDLARWFNTQDVLYYGTEGTGVLGGTEPGFQKFDLSVPFYDEGDQLLLWDGQEFKSLLPPDYNGEPFEDTFFVETTSDEWGFLIIDSFPYTEGSLSAAEISNVEWLPNYTGELSQLYYPQYDSQYIEDRPYN